MEPRDQKAMIFELTDGILRSWWTVVAGIFFGLAAATLALNFIPRVYEAGTKLLVVPQQVPGEFIKSTVTEDMTRRAHALGEQIFDETNLLEPLSKYYRVPEDDKGRRSLIRAVRSRADLGINAREGLLFVTYQDGDPELAAAMANTLTQVYIETSKKFRTDQAEGTTDSVRARAEEYKTELDKKHAELNGFLQQHYAETAESYPANLQQLEARQNDLEASRTKQDEINRELPVLRARLRKAQNAPTGSDPDADVAAVDPLTQQLRQRRAQLDALLVDYQEAHPQVQRKKREIEDLESRIAARDATAPPQTPDSPKPAAPLSPLAAQIASLETDLARLDRDQLGIRRDIGMLERRIAATPSVQTRLEQLVSERDLLSTKFLEFQTHLDTAEDAETLEASERAQQIQVVEEAIVPTRPIHPQPLKIYLVGVMIGCLLFVGPLPARRLLNPLVASEAGMREFEGVPLLVTIPRIITEEARGFASRQLAKNLSLSILATIVFAAVYVYVNGIGG
ncbi:MAG: hypothetical protein GY716_18780 [bacterium]|nr:hypothetical protein [bacterium]